MNRQWLLARKPPGGLPTDEDFTMVETPAPEPGPNQMLTRTIYLSLDPYQWGRKRSGLEAVGEVCHGRTVSQVVKSRLPEYTEGDFVFNTNGWQAYGLTGEGISVFGYMVPRRLDPAQAPISTAVGIMGMLGLTAYSGMVVQCQPQAGETVVVSAASGGVGQIAGQLAKIFGCRVVGIAGIKEKCDFVTGVLGFDACVSHKSATLAEDLREACPAGIDAYFENVGGQVFAAVLPLLNRQSRISLCGLVSQYSATTSAMRMTPGWPRVRPSSSGSMSRCTGCMCATSSPSTRRTFSSRWPIGSARAKSNTKRTYGLGLSRHRRPSEPCWRAAILARRSSAWGMTPPLTRP